MRYLKILVAVSLIVSLTPCKAQDMKDIFDEDKDITWLGLDFTSAKFIGDRQRLGTSSDIQRLLQSWNDLIMTENEKFGIGQYIGKTKVTSDFSVTKEHNAALDVLDMTSSDSKDEFHLRTSMIQEIINGYDFKDNQGVGVMFVVEAFNKTTEQGAAWITFVNLSTKEVFFAERITGNASGFGLRNYWGNSFYGMMKQIKKREFEMWRKKYYRK